MPLKDFPADLFRDELANEGVVTDAVDYTEQATTRR
jgi:sugar/nucleoside kinase (ribokinase family)